MIHSNVSLVQGESLWSCARLELFALVPVFKGAVIPSVSGNLTPTDVRERSHNRCVVAEP